MHLDPELHALFKSYTGQNKPSRFSLFGRIKGRSIRRALKKNGHRKYGNGEFWVSKMEIQKGFMRRDNDLRSLFKADDALISQSGEKVRLASPASRATTDVRRVDWCCKHSSSSPFLHPTHALMVDYKGV